MKFGSQLASDSFRDIPEDKSGCWAEIRCPRRHLMGVVTDTEVLFGQQPIARSAAGPQPTMCEKCGKHGLDYLIDMGLLRARVSVRRSQPTQIRIEDISTPVVY